MASILETFYVLFKSNSKDVEEGNKKAKDSTNKLQTSMEESEKGSRKLGESFADIASELTNVIAGFLSIGTVIEGLKSAQEYSNSIYDLSKAIGVNAQDLDVWGRAVEQVGGKAAGFQGTISKLSNVLAHAATFGGGAESLEEPLGRFGVHIRNNQGNVKTPIQLLEELAPIFQKLGDVRARAFGQSLGFDPGTILLLEKGQAGLSEIIKEQQRLGAQTKESTEIAHRFGIQWDDLGYSIRTLFTNLNNSTLPTFGKLLHGITDVFVFLNDHAKATEGFLVGMAVAITVALIPAIISLITVLAPLIGWPIVIGAAFAFLFSNWTSWSKNVSEVADVAIHRWNQFLNLLKEIANFFTRVTNARTAFQDKLLSDLGFKVTPNLATAKSKINTAQRTRLPAFQQALQGGTRAISVTMGNISVVTQANDPQGVLDAIRGSLLAEMRRAVGSFDDSVIG